jgi:hypothetical protein
VPRWREFGEMRSHGRIGRTEGMRAPSRVEALMSGGKAGHGNGGRLSARSIDEGGIDKLRSTRRWTSMTTFAGAEEKEEDDHNTGC